MGAARGLVRVDAWYSHGLDNYFYINKLKGLSAINIIHLDPSSSNGSFFEHWHTVNDNLENIDPKTLEIVGNTLLNVIYRE